LSANDTLIIAQCQQLPNALNVAATLSSLKQTVIQAADWGVELLVLPEMCMTGYNITPTELDEVAESQQGELFTQIAQLAQTHSMAIAYGYAERDVNGHIYNSVQLVDDTGTSQLNYRKTHLWGELDQSLFQAGSALSSVVNIKGWQVAAAICFDIEFPETARHLAIAGAELIIVPTGLMHPFYEVAQQVVPVRAYENGLFIAYTNYCGQERDIRYIGCSCIVDPNGLILAKGNDHPVLLSATLHRQDIVAARQRLPYLRSRRPELYSH